VKGIRGYSVIIHTQRLSSDGRVVSTSLSPETAQAETGLLPVIFRHGPRSYEDDASWTEKKRPSEPFVRSGICSRTVLSLKFPLLAASGEETRNGQHGRYITKQALKSPQSASFFRKSRPTASDARRASDTQLESTSSMAADGPRPSESDMMPAATRTRHASDDPPLPLAPGRDRVQGAECQAGRAGEPEQVA
jgi:hypothetical protein